jgi:hypothetical protein
LYVKGEVHELVPEAALHFGPEIDLLRVLYAEGRVSLEGEWGFNKDWEPTSWDSAWLRMKLDTMVYWAPDYATAIDYKTGKKFGNEVKHAEQMQLYALGAFMRHAELEVVDGGKQRRGVARRGLADRGAQGRHHRGLRRHRTAAARHVGAVVLPLQVGQRRDLIGARGAFGGEGLHGAAGEYGSLAHSARSPEANFSRRR